ncbi:MAG: NRDE family protein [Pseudomonadota bacterium]|nr:NRDE family protein [Pseudomonadota bacterium]
MCLIILAWNPTPGYRLALAANRDEFVSRPTARLGFHDGAPDVLAGRDLEKGGTWLGITRNGRFAGVTNFRSSIAPPPNARSRGLVVSEFLESDDPPAEFLARLRTRRAFYAGFSLFAGNPHELWYYHSPKDLLRRLDTGLYGLSNRELDTPWPKVLRGKSALSELIISGAISAKAVFSMLGDRSFPRNEDLPDTGVGLSLERVLGPVFIDAAGYGTRSSTFLMVRSDGEVTMTERTHDPPLRPDRNFEFRIDAAG